MLKSWLSYQKNSYSKFRNKKIYRLSGYFNGLHDSRKALNYEELVATHKDREKLLVLEVILEQIG